MEFCLRPSMRTMVRRLLFCLLSVLIVGSAVCISASREEYFSATGAATSSGLGTLSQRTMSVQLTKPIYTTPGSSSSHSASPPRSISLSLFGAAKTEEFSQSEVVKWSGEIEKCAYVGDAVGTELLLLQGPSGKGEPMYLKVRENTRENSTEK
jgi:hypothetical protein